MNHSDVHAESLADALSQNVYVKSEVDKMLEKVYRKFEERTQKIAEHTHQVEKQTIAIKSEMNRLFFKYTISTITILGSWITITMGLFAYIVHLIHL